MNLGRQLNGNLEIQCETDLRTRTVLLWFLGVPRNGGHHVDQFTYVSGVNVTQAYEGTLLQPNDTPFQLVPEEATELMDALWAAGIRPTVAKEAEIEQDERSALKAHIHDLRTIAFAKCGVTLPDDVRRIRTDD